MDSLSGLLEKINLSFIVKGVEVGENTPRNKNGT